MMKINLQKLKKNRAFVILFAVTLSAILLSIALGVANIAFREVKFGTDARATNDAFFAADVGIECAEYYTRGDPDPSNPPSDNPNNAFTGNASMNCAGNSIPIDKTLAPKYSFLVLGLGNTKQGCANVTLYLSDIYNESVITSKGYNDGSASNCAPGSNTVEREIDVNY